MTSLFFAIALVTSSCDDSDIGRECPGLDTESSSGDGRAETEEIVAIDAQFPCNSLICVATDGVDGYCSKKCRDDVSCPDAFECRKVQELGQFQNDKFCAWKRCEKSADCGDKDTYCCRAVPAADPSGSAKLCGLRDSDDCS